MKRPRPSIEIAMPAAAGLPVKASLRIKRFGRIENAGLAIFGQGFVQRFREKRASLRNASAPARRI